jgi:putative heme-binding domain-containing protein
LEDADGSVLVLDTGGWYMLCCPTSQQPKPDVLGAIYRVRRTGKHKVADPRGKEIDWQALNVDQLVQQMNDVRPAVSRRAQNLLAAKGKEAVNALTKAAQTAERRQQKLHAVWTLTRIDDPAARAAVRAALDSSDSDVRQAAIHSASVWRDAQAAGQLAKLLASEALDNRRAAAEALGRLGDKDSIDDLLAAAGDYRGRIVEHSLIYALYEIGDMERIERGLTAANPHTNRAALMALENLSGKTLAADKVVKLLDSDAPVLADTALWITRRHPEWADTMTSYFQKRIFDLNLPAEAAAPLAAHLARFAESPRIQEVLANGLADPKVPDRTKMAILDAIAASAQQAVPSTLSAQIARLLALDNPEIVGRTVAAVRAISKSPLAPEVAGALARVAANDKLPLEVRLAALAARPAGHPLDADGMRLVANELTAERPIRHRSLAIDVLLAAKLEDRQLLLLMPVLPKTVSMDLARLLAVFEKSASEAVGEKLVAALSANSAASALDAAVVNKLIGRYGAKVAAQAAPLLARIEAAGKEKTARLETVLALVPQGDVRRGQQIFQSTKAACSACHAVGYAGGRIGPDLTRIGAIRDERALLESVLFPSATFVQSFEPVVIETKSGLVHSGVVKNETREEIELILDAQKTIRIPLGEIEKRLAGTVSIMPTGLDQQLTPQELADLILFLKNAQ